MLSCAIVSQPSYFLLISRRSWNAKVNTVYLMRMKTKSMYTTCSRKRMILMKRCLLMMRVMRKVRFCFCFSCLLHWSTMHLTLFCPFTLYIPQYLFLCMYIRIICGMGISFLFCISPHEFVYKTIGALVLLGCNRIIFFTSSPHSYIGSFLLILKVKQNFFLM